MNIFEKIKAWFFKEEKRVLESFNEILELEKAAQAKVVDVVDAVEEKVEVIKVEAKKVSDQITDSVTQIKKPRKPRAKK
jgi:hypothetical protein